MELSRSSPVVIKDWFYDAKMRTQDNSPVPNTQPHKPYTHTNTMDFPQQRGVHFPGNAPPAAGTPGTAAFQASQHPRSAPSSYHHPVPGRPRGYADVVQDAVFLPANAAGNHRPDENWERVLPLAENPAAHGQPQDLRNVDMAYYDMVNDHPPLHERHANNNYAGVALNLNVPAQVPAPVPIDIFDDPAQHAAAGPAPGFLNEMPYQCPVPNGTANEVLRQLAILYLREPNSQVAAIRMEPGHVHGVRVVIALDLSDI
ncbi:hypothetical protein BJV77DRAFT_1014771 [Russula vinacea]|nr:hypothetical protein BJV77DRAFT_1014771 [Russula vinacea]